MRLTRRTGLAMLLASLVALTAVVLAGVIGTVVFAVTMAYVLYPLRQRLRERGFSRRAAAATPAAAALVGVLALAVPVAYALYRRRGTLVEFLADIPEEVVVEFGTLVYVVETEPVLQAAVRSLRSLAVSVASAAPVIALKALVFALLVYGLLYKPHAARIALLRLCPGEYHDVLFALHRRTATTLRAIYVLQAATAAGTFLVALVTFAALGYESPFVLAVVSGVLQFVPVLGPSIVVLTLAAVDLVAGNALRAVLVTVLGLFLIGFAPDAIIRPRLAGETTDLPVSVYFVGFVGGLLTVGAVGFVVGPLVVALLAETVGLLSAGGATRQSQLSLEAVPTLGEERGPGPTEPAGDGGTDAGATEPGEPGEGTESADGNR